MKKRDVQYKLSLVSYTDILGFSALIKEKSANEMSRILRLFRDAGNPAQSKAQIPKLRPRDFVTFSDLWLVSIPLRRRRRESVRGVIIDHLLHLMYTQIAL